MDIREILKVLPHRYPFLLVDRVLEADERRFKALKNVTFNEPHFQGHFPGHPVMPGVLILEAMAQAAVGALVRQPGLLIAPAPYRSLNDGGCLGLRAIQRVARLLLS